MTLHESLPQSADSQPSSGSGEPHEFFGRYLLLKLLKRDALGETHRAGRIGASAIERVVSLRLFNGAGIDGERFWQACQSRQELGSTLRGGPFGEVVDCSYEGGVCYVAHEFVFGRSLAEILDQAKETACPIPIEHAIQIMDRVAMCLHNANGKRLEGKRVNHGFLVPAFVQISSEGEVRLTGFESTGGILDLPVDGAVRSQLAGYTSPEVNQGQSPTAADDVYSMGSILFELLTGEKLPPMTENGAGQWIDTGVLAEEAAPLSDGVRQLLHQSLAPRDQRIRSAELWHRELGGITAAGEYSPTTFNLAFFMHTLFGEELDREVRVVEREKQQPVPPPTPVRTEAGPEPAIITDIDTDQEVVALERAVESAFSEPVLESEAVSELPEDSDPLDDGGPSKTTSTAQARTQAAPSADSRHRLFAGLAVLALAVALALALLVFDLPIPGMGGSKAQPLMVAAAPSVDDVAAMEPDEPASDPIASELTEVAPPLSPEEIESQVRSLVAKRAGSMEASLKAEYDQRLVELRTQLEGARQATATKQLTPPSTDASLLREQASAPGEQFAPPEIEALPTQAAPVDEPARSAPTPSIEAEAEEPEPAVAAAAPDRQPALEPLAAAAETEPEPVEPGSIVEQGPGVDAPTLVRQPSVVYPPAAVRLKREASVRVRILVDEQGRPTEIEQVGPKVGMGFDQAALRAAKSTRWSPPTQDGVPVKMWVELSVDFRP